MTAQLHIWPKYIESMLCRWLHTCSIGHSRHFNVRPSRFRPDRQAADIVRGVGLFPVFDVRFLALPGANVLLYNSFKYQLLACFYCFEIQARWIGVKRHCCFACCHLLGILLPRQPRSLCWEESTLSWTLREVSGVRQLNAGNLNEVSFYFIFGR